MTLERRDLLALPLLILLAAVLRFGDGDIVEYFHDDAMLATLALELADGLRFPLTGILSSTGIPNAPISVYIMAIPFVFSSDPLFAIHFVMLLNVIGVALLWVLARRYFGARIAFIATLLYAVNPWAILFSRKIWAQELHTPLILFALLLLLHGYSNLRPSPSRSRSRFWAQVFAIPLFLAALQIHFAALALLPVLPLLLWTGRKQIIRPALLLAVLLSALLIAPYIIGLSQTLAADPNRILDALSRSSNRGPALQPRCPQRRPATRLRLRLDELARAHSTRFSRSADARRRTTKPAPPANARSRHSCTAFAFTPFAAFLLLWSFLPFLSLLFEWTPVYIHYFIPSIPALMLLVAFGVDRILAKIADRRAWRIVVFAFLFTICAAQIVQWRTALIFVAENHIAYPGFTTPLRKLIPLRDRLQQSNDVIVIGGGMSWNLHHEVAVWDTLLWDDVACVRTLAADGYAVFPSHPFTVVIAPEAEPNPIDNLYAKDDLEIYPTRSGGVDHLVYSWDSAPEWKNGDLHPLEPQRFDNGVLLIGYGFSDTDVVLHWQLPAQQIGTDYQFSAQLFDAAGLRIAQQDKTFWQGRHWCDGDKLLTWVPLKLDDRAATLKVSLYKLGVGVESGQYFPANLLDEMGNPKGQSIDISLD